MNIKIIILLYLLVGIFRLLFEFFKPVPRQPIYLIKRNYIGMLISILFWPLVIIIRIRSELLIKKPKIEKNIETMKKIQEYQKNNKVFLTTFKVRCPKCGNFAVGIIDPENKDLYQKMQQQKNTNYKEYDIEFEIKLRAGKIEIPLICKNCGHQFTKNDADIWEKVSNTFGNKIAIIEYHRKQKGIENEINKDDE